MSRSEPGLTIDIPAEATQVALVRHAMTGLAQSIGMDEEAVADVQTVVTEACMNAVLHAYPDGGGRITVEAAADTEEMTIRVSDAGIGFRPGADDPRGDGESLRLGLTLIAALTAGYEIAGGAGKGTTVTMRMPIRATELEPAGDRPSADGVPEVRVTARDREVLPHVLPRTIAAFAAERDLSVERLSDSMLLGDAIADAAVAAFGDAHPSFDLATVDGGLELSVGPLADEGVETLRAALDLPEGQGSIEALVDEVRIEERPGGTAVIFRLVTSANA